MEKEKSHEEVKVDSEKNAEVLEISPTGYGFVYVPEDEDPQKIDQQK